MAAIARVEPLTTARALRGPFDYLLPEELRDSVGVGSMLVVPFGRRELVGVVTGLAEESSVDAKRLLAPRRALESSVPAELVELASWVASEYCSTRARALALVLPPNAPGPATRVEAALTADGFAALETGSGVRLSSGQRTLLESLRTADGPLPSVVVAAADSASLRRLRDRGLVSLEHQEIRRRPLHAPVGALRGAPPALSADQAAALVPIEAAIAEGRHERFLLHGVTGSGKTEIYLRAAAAALQQQRGAIILVPEIGLTPQTVVRFTERFGEVVAVLHSRLSAAERRDEWLRLRSGEARICVGPRSAAFAPVDDLGVVVIDEEHDASYKHEGDPRYDARQVAAWRAERAGAVLIAGSATPRPESFVALRQLRLAERVDGRPLPAVEVLDMRGVRGALHPHTSAALAELRRGGGKGIILLNRRGWSNFLSCSGCGRVWGCPQCDVSLVLHRSENLLACHHCGHRERVPQACSNCGSTAVARHGFGTERLEHELAAALGEAVDADAPWPVFRLDADVAGARGQAGAVLRRFESAPAGLLVGTQMVAKGHDFDGISLGVVLDADATLRFPDFRAEERTFALVAQLAGRTGRGPLGAGRVLVQTIAPDASCITLAAHHDSEGFLAAELGRRQALGYPPYGDLIRVVCLAEADALAQKAATAVRRLINVPGVDVLGPAPLFRLRGRARSQLVVKASEREAAIAAVGAAVADVAAQRAFRAASFSVDVDPQ